MCTVLQRGKVNASSLGLAQNLGSEIVACALLSTLLDRGHGTPADTDLSRVLNSLEDGIGKVVAYKGYARLLKPVRR